MSWFSIVREPCPLLVGVDISLRAVRFAVARRLWPASPRFIDLASLSFATQPASDAVTGALSRLTLEGGWTGFPAAFCLSGNSALTRSLRLPVTRLAELDGALSFEVEQLFHFPPAEIHVDYQVLGVDRKSGNTDVVVAAGRRDAVVERLRQVKEAGLRPAILDLEAFALFNLYLANYPNEKGALTLLLYFQGYEALLVLASGRKYLLNRRIGISNEDNRSGFVTSAVGPVPPSRACKDSLKSATPRPATGPALSSDRLILEIGKTLESLRNLKPSGPLHRALLCGESESVIELAPVLNQRFEIPAEPLDPFRRLKLGRKLRDHREQRVFSGEYAIAVGLALRVGEA